MPGPVSDVRNSAAVCDFEEIAVPQGLSKHAVSTCMHARDQIPKRAWYRRDEILHRTACPARSGAEPCSSVTLGDLFFQTEFVYLF